MSRPRTSTELKLVSGTFRRDRSAPKTTLARLERMPTAPKHLSAETRKQWRRLAPAVKETGAMTASDLIAFELLCRTLATAIEAEEIIADEGATIAAGHSDPARALQTGQRVENEFAAIWIVSTGNFVAGFVVDDVLM